MLALSIRQPFAELILRGEKRIEYRSRSTRVIGERFHLYATKTWAKPPSDRGKAWSLDLGMADGGKATPPWIIELANGLKLFSRVGELPRGVIVGSAVIEKVLPREDGMFEWHLADVERAVMLRKPTRQPQPVWFRAF